MSQDDQPLRIRVDDVSPGEWHALMGRFLDIHYEQSAVYGGGRSRETQSTILLSRGPEPVAGARLGIVKMPFINRGIALLRFGPFWRRQGDDLDSARYCAVMRAIVDEYGAQRKLYVIVRPRPHPEIYPVESAALESLGFQRNEGAILDRSFVDVSLDEDEQMKSFDQGWRAKLRKALRSGIEVRLENNDQGAAIFAAIYGQMVTRKSLDYEGLERAELTPQLMGLPDHMRLSIAVAWLGDTPVAAASFAVVGDVAYYVFGASSARALEVNAGYALQWQIINWLRGRGVRWYELGGPGDAGIRQFKKGLAGKRGLILPVREYHYAADTIAQVVASSVFTLRDALASMRGLQRKRAERSSAA